MFEAVHLARRFFGSLSARPPDAADEAWAIGHLLIGEVELWRQMSNPDRRHAVGVALEVERLLDADATRPVLAAALLHDVGKVDSGLGTFARAAATIVNRRQGDGRFARYRRHDIIGAELLAAAHSDDLTVVWAREHHLEPNRWTLDRRVATALKAADND